VTLFLILLYLGFMGLSLFPNTIILFLFIISYPLSLLYGLSLFLYILSYPEAYVPFHYTFPIYISWYTLGSLPPSSLPGYCHPYPLFPLHILYNILLSIITGTQLIPNKKIINKRKIEITRWNSLNSWYYSPYLSSTILSLGPFPCIKTIPGS